MKFIADLHLHSKYSRATARNLDFENLYIASQIKGITLLASADFTHPGWWQAIEDALIPAEEGLFQLKPDLARACNARVPAACRRDVRFMLVCEISNIYKKDQRTRKNHNLVFMPDLAAAEQFRRRLERIGNISADGRPILGLDARDLLEIVLETSDRGYLIPAHVWTPWFSLLGSKSGFDSVQACFGDLSDHIFALETGLSSDPPMNWRVSALDGYTLVSNSDAHSPSKLGREANRFDTELSYAAVRAALENPSEGGFAGTIEFFPQEGKYHLDGHRKCGFRSQPKKTRELNGFCPVCGKELTLGVLYRVESLSDRPQGERPHHAMPFTNLIPLEDILAEVLQAGPKSKKVTQAFEHLIQRHGAEFDILEQVPLEELNQAGPPLLGPAIERMRANQVHFEPGYDGEYGQVRIFDPAERRMLLGQQSLFALPDQPVQKERPPETQPAERAVLMPKTRYACFNPAQARLNAEQQVCVDHAGGPMVILAGPGTGKTRTITCRMAHIIEHKKVPSDRILAVTFTNQAAKEMAQRLINMLGQGVSLPLTTTFHSLCRQLLMEADDNQPAVIADEATRRDILADAIQQVRSRGRKISLSTESLLDAVERTKQSLTDPGGDLAAVVGDRLAEQLQPVYETYQNLMTLQNLLDFEDLIFKCVRLLETDSAWRKALQRRFAYIFVDEFQDINDGQYALIRLLAADHGNICVIGDPDQAIYGFRGSDVRYFTRFKKDFSNPTLYTLTRNYRSTQTILDASFQVIQGHQLMLDSGEPRRTQSILSGAGFIGLLETLSPAAEAVAIGKTIEQMVGGTGFHAVDFGKTEDGSGSHGYSFADMAVLFRTGEQGRFLHEALTKAGLPCQLASREDWRNRPVISKVLALLRIVTDQGSFSDLDQVREISAPAASQKTLALFRNWSYQKQLPLATALHTALRLPIAGLSARQQHKLAALVRKLERIRQETAGLPLVEIIARLAGHIGLSTPQDQADIIFLQEAATPFRDATHHFMASQALGRDTDLYRAGVEKIALLTLHAAKGLEFPVVFIAGCEDGLIPYYRNKQTAGDQEEERRLFYVAMTRAKEHLFCSMARRRRLHGKTGERKLSPFIQVIAQGLIHRSAGNHRIPPRKHEQLSLF